MKPLPADFDKIILESLCCAGDDHTIADGGDDVLLKTLPFHAIGYPSLIPAPGSQCAPAAGAFLCMKCAGARKPAIWAVKVVEASIHRIPVRELLPLQNDWVTRMHRGRIQWIPV